MNILAIESSCDETAVAVVNDEKQVLAHTVLSQLDDHQPYGGVVPEIAARAHIHHLDSLIARTMEESGLRYEDIDAVAATGGPGLIGGVIVGVISAKALASTLSKPFIAVNHLEGHALTVRLTDDVSFPFLLLLVSGGHCQILIAEGVGKYQLLGTTKDDALGEAFDKVAKMMKLGYPGGPIVESYAKQGDASIYDLPRPLKGQEGCDFSLSGLKTAVKRQIDAAGEMTKEDQQNLCASFQEACGDVLVDRLSHAFATYIGQYPNDRTLVVAGGVAANQYLNNRLKEVAAEHQFEVVSPPIDLCTDNAAMIGWAAIERLQAGLTDSLDFAPRARWPLQED